jgi:hypothetical protein
VIAQAGVVDQNIDGESARFSDESLEIGGVREIHGQTVHLEAIASDLRR